MLQGKDDGEIDLVKPAAFKYAKVRSIDEALALKARYGGEARFLAGGQSLIPAMNFRLAQPAVLIDLNPVTALAGIRSQAPEAVRIGAVTRYRSLQRNEAIKQRQPLLSEALPHVAHPQIRNRGTLGGNLAQADPASELPAVMLALGAQLHVRSAGAERRLPAAEFFVGPLTTALKEDELLAEIELPDLPARSGTCFLEVARRRGDYAMMGIACVVTLDAAGTCVAARLAFCSAGETPLLAPQAAAALVGRKIGDAEIEAAAAEVPRDIHPFGGLHASREFQLHLAAVLTRRAVRTAVVRASAEGRA